MGMWDSTPDDYYRRCAERERAAWQALQAALCTPCYGRGEHYNMERDERRRCQTCGGSGCATGYTADDVRRLRRAHEQAAYVGD